MQENFNLFGFKNPLSYENSVTTQRENRIYNGIQNSLNEHYNNIRMEEEQKQIEAEFQRSVMFESAQLSARLSAKEKFIQESQIRNKLDTFFKASFLSEAVFKSLPFDEDYLMYNEDIIKKELRNFIIENSEVLKLENLGTKSLVLEEVQAEIDCLVETVLENTNEISINNESQLLELYNEAPKNNAIADEIANMVKEKVMETLEKEKVKAKSNKENEKEVAKKKKEDDEEVYGDEIEADAAEMDAEGDMDDDDDVDSEDIDVDSEDMDSDDASEDDTLETDEESEDMDDEPSSELDEEFEDEDGNGVNDSDQLDDEFKSEEEVEQEITQGKFKFTITTDTPNFTITAEELNESSEPYLYGYKSLASFLTCSLKVFIVSMFL